jgi:hypothetical protein
MKKLLKKSGSEVAAANFPPRACVTAETVVTGQALGGNWQNAGIPFISEHVFTLALKP